MSGVGERPTRDTPHPGKMRPPLGALVPPQPRAKPARKSACCGVGDGSRHPQPPHPQPVGSGPWPHAPKMGGRAWESAQPRTPGTQARAAPARGTLVLPPKRAKPACNRARCGVGDGSPRPHPRNPQLVGSGPQPHAPRTGAGAWESARTPDTPHQRKKRPPPGALVPPPKRAKPANKSAPCGVVDTSPRPRPPQPQPVGSGHRPHAPRTGSRAWESAQLQTPNAQARDAPPPPRGALMQPPERAKRARKSAGCGVGDGSTHPYPPHPQPVGDGPRPHASWVGGRA